MKIKTVKDIVDWRLCIGCGACAYFCPEENIELINFHNDGIRPILKNEDCESCSKCLDVCPGFELTHQSFTATNGILKDQLKNFGPILEIWEGYPVDSKVRFHGSSAGMATALATYCLDRKDMHGVLHIGSDENDPLVNKTYFSRSSQELLSRTGSRYAPASPCNQLGLIENAPKECVFIGKPCDVSAVKKAQAHKEQLKEKTGITIAIFCAGTPSTKATLDLLESQKINPSTVQNVRYRGNGWPGKFSVTFYDNVKNPFSITYQKSWGFLQAYRPFRCHLCPEGTGDSADISCGDPWYREVEEGELGSSLIIVRTRRGQDLIRAARDDGYIKIHPLKPNQLKDSQINLLKKRRAIWGRIMTMKVFAIPTTKYKGYFLFRNWLEASLEDQIRSFLSTLKRIVLRKIYKRNKIV